MADLNSDGGQGAISPVTLAVAEKALIEVFPTSYNYKSHCSFLGSPSEKGLMQYDNKVIQPATVQFTGIVKYEHWDDILKILRWQTKSQDLGKIRCTFYGKTGRAENMLIESVEEVGESEMYDGVEIRVQLQEYLEHNVE